MTTTGEHDTITITISRETAGFIVSGFAMTKFNGRADVQARRAAASEEFDKALREAMKNA